MPRPVCVACVVEMVWVRAVTVQFNARSVAGAYQQWQGDLCACPNCKIEVVARFGLQASWEHHHKVPPTDTPYVTVPERSITDLQREISRR